MGGSGNGVGGSGNGVSRGTVDPASVIPAKAGISLLHNLASRARARELGYARARISVVFCRILSIFAGASGELMIDDCRLGIARWLLGSVVSLEWTWV